MHYSLCVQEGVLDEENLNNDDNDNVCTHLHYSICRKLDIETAENWYSHIPKTICEHEDVTVLWNQWLQIGSG